MSSLVTIICDASFATHDGTNASGWAGFVACEGFKRYFGDSMHVQPLNNTTAEAFAVVNTLHCAIQAGMVVHGDRLIIQTDCLAAISLLQKPYPKISLVGKKAAGKIQSSEAYVVLRKMLAQYALTVEWRHVRGHTGIADNRSIVQEKCDKKAKYHMAVQAAERRAQKNGGKAQVVENDHEWPDVGRCSA